MSNPTEASFLKDVAKHEMRVLLDRGVHRHLRFQQPLDSNMWFEIVTWPGSLAYRGDMGSFVFSRLDDMFKFFRTDRTTAENLCVNLSYWGEKLEAVDRIGEKGSHREFSEDKFRSSVEEHISEWVTDLNMDAKSAKSLRELVAEQVVFDEGAHEAFRTIGQFSEEIGGRKFEFHDTWEWDYEAYTYRYVWCCYALAWAINKYDASREPTPSPMQERVIGGERMRFTDGVVMGPEFLLSETK